MDKGNPEEYYSLNGLEMKYLNPNTPILLYTDLYKYESPKELFNNSDSIILLYLLQSKSVGHWVLLFKNNDGYNLFDSYGVPSDFELDFLSPEKRKELNQQYDYLTLLFRNVPLIYNNIQLQKGERQNCGCFVSHRNLNKHLTAEQYVNVFIDYNLEPNKYVVDYCFKKLGYK